VSVERARSVVESRLAGALTGSDMLHFAEHGAVPVADVLADPGRFDECSLYDPLEPDYGGSSTAMFFANDMTTGTAIVFSHAHGGRSFVLRHDESTLRARLAAMDPEDVVAGWARMVAAAALAPDAEERVLADVRGLTKTSIAGLRKALKATKFEARQRDLGAAPDPADEFAQAFLKEFYAGGATLIFTETRAFWRYTGTHWASVAEPTLRGEVQQLASMRWDAVCAGFAAQGKAAPALSAFVVSVMALLAGKTVRDGDPLRLNSPRPAVLNMKNGELWLDAEGPVLRPHRPDSYLTACSDITYDAQAKAPGFDKALRGILSLTGGVPMVDQDEMVRHVEELLGYAAQTERDLKVFMLFTGPGDNGKTRLSKLLQLIVGQDAIVFDRLSGIDDNQFSTSKLVGKQILVDDDADHEYLLPDGLLKKIAESKPLTAERKYEGAFTFVASVVPIILANSWPRSRDLSRGMQTRAQVLYLPRSFKRPEECASSDPDRQRPEVWEQVYANEMPGVVNALIAGYYRVRKRRGFSQPPSARTAFDAWLRDANVVSRFLAEACERADPTRPGVTSRVLNQVFNAWADAEGVAAAHRPQANRMRSRLEELGFKVAHTNRGTAVYGLKPRAEWMDRVFELPEEMSETSLQAMGLEAEIAAAGLSDLL
jgi:P4 family phage/plasmid primase-like protien